jgi:hypothetical protein
VSDEWPQEELKDDVNMIMTIKPGPSKPPTYHFPRASAIHDVIIEKLDLQPIVDPTTRGASISTFLREAINVADPSHMNKDLNSAQELLGFSRYDSDQISQIMTRYGIKPPNSTDEYPHDSKTVRRHLAKLEQIDPKLRNAALEDKTPDVMSNPTARDRQKDTWTPAVVGALYSLLRTHRSQAQALALYLNLRPNVTENQPSTGAPDLAIQAVTPSQSDQALVMSAKLRDRLRARDVRDEVRREIVDSEILQHLPRAPAPAIVAVRGDAGAGKTVIAGQTYDALSQSLDAAVIVVPCQFLKTAPITFKEFDSAFGELIGADSGLIAVARAALGQQSRPVVVILDTIDNVLNDHTHAGIIELFRQMLDAGASIVFTCRHYDYSIWFRHEQERLGLPVAAGIVAVNVPPLNLEEVRKIINGYLVLHPPDQPLDGDDFAQQVWDISQLRGPMQSIVTNPFFLLMLCETFASSGEVPPDLTTTRLCDTYRRKKIATSRKYRHNNEVSKAKRLLWQDIGAELWRRSADRIVLTLPESWLEGNKKDGPALDDLLSEDVLIRPELDGTAIQFRHQFLAEYSMAISLRDTAPEELDRVLAELREDPNSRWFAWQVVRHALATSLSESDIERLLGQMDLTEAFAFQAAARGLAEQKHRGYLLRLASYKEHYGALFEHDVLHFVPDNGLDEAFSLLVHIIREGINENVSDAAIVAGKLALRLTDGTGSGLTKLVEIMEAIGEIRQGRAVAEPKDTSLPDQLLESLLSPAVDRNVKLPDDVLVHICTLLSGATSIGFRIAIQAHLVDGVSVNLQRKLLEKLLSSREANKLQDWGSKLVNISVVWNVSSDTEGERNDWTSLRPVDFLAAGRKTNIQLRAAALAKAAHADKSLRESVVDVFVRTSANDKHNGALICLQEVVKACGQQWLLESLQARTDDCRAIVGPLCGLLKSLVSKSSTVRHAWAAWFRSFVTKDRYGTVDAYLQLGWDDANHLKYATRMLKLLPIEQRGSIAANFASELSPEKADVIESISTVMDLGDNPLLRVRLMDITGDDVPAGLIELITSPSKNAAAQAMRKLEVAARDKYPWV